MEHSISLPLFPKIQQTRAQSAASYRPKISHRRRPIRLPRSRQTRRHSAPYPNAIPSKSGASQVTPPDKFLVNSRPHPQTHSSQELSSRKKLRGGNPSSARKEMSAACPQCPLKTSPASGSVRSPLPRDL